MKYKRAGRFDQIKTYTRQCFSIAKNEKQWKLLISTLLLMIIVAVVIDRGAKGVFGHYAPTEQGLFVVMCGCVWVGIFNSIQSICKERDIIKKEKQTGMHISSYIMAHVIYEFILCLAEALIVVGVLLFAVGKNLPSKGILTSPVIEMYISFFLVLFAADMLALLISCIVRTTTMAMTVMPFVLIIQLVFSDAVITLSDGIRKFADLTVVKWGMQALLVIADTKDSVINTAKDTSKQMIINPQTNMPEFQDLDLGAKHLLPEAGNLTEAWGWLILFSVLYIILAIIALKQVSRDKR